MKPQIIGLLLFIKICSGGELNIIELDHDLGPHTPYLVTPGAEPFSLEVIEAGDTRGFWLAFGKYKAMEHMGTHVAAPYTHYEDGITVDQIPVEDYFGEVAVIDIRKKVTSNHTYELSERDVRDWVRSNGVFPNNCFVAINTGWDVDRYPDQLAYYGDDRGISNLRFPGVTLEATQAILDYEKSHGIRIIAFAIDAPRLDHGPSKIPRSSGLIASLNKYEVRNLRNLHKLPPRGARLLVAPLKIRYGAGAQARVLARLPYERDF